MTQLAWDEVGERFYEAGVDRGVLYPLNMPGVVWNGLVSVTERPSGGELSEFHYDGVKYLSILSSTDFKATLEAFTYPDEFGICDGTLEIQPGLFAKDQPRSRFHLSYRTMIGNDVEGSDFGYKIHLIYNALAAPSEEDNSTFAQTIEPKNFSWEIDAIPIFGDFVPTAHFILDSRKLTDSVLVVLEDILYGDGINQPRMPSISEIIEIIDTWSLINIIDNDDGTWTAIGPDELITMTDATTFEITGVNAIYLSPDTYEISTT